MARRIWWLTLRAGSLNCDTADEAKTLVPSLVNKMADEDLQRMLDDMAKLCEFE